MANELYDLGENFLNLNDMSGVTYDVGLYDESTDLLADSATYASITTEPAGASYASQSATATVTGNALDLATVTFDVSDSTATVDSVYVRDSVSGDLLFSNNIGTQDLSTKDGSLEVSGTGITLN